MNSDAFSDIFFNKLNIKLNPQQKEAVQAVNGPVLLLAVPGSGKTTVLVARLGYMIFVCGIPPSKILVLTYTVSAVNDMRERFMKLFGEKYAAEIKFKTINSLCQGIIKAYGRRIGKEPFELETDEDEIISIISLQYQEYEDKYPEESELNEIKTQITYIKNMMLSDSEIRELEEVSAFRLFEIYKGYCNELRIRSRMDYDDQMLYAYKLLKSDSAFLKYCQDCYSYICVDEAQDTSKIQHKIIELLASNNKNIFMVGDEDQSIYGFRAAYPEALLSFERNHSGARLLLMEDNFRSDGNIVEAADFFIQENKLRHKKHMRAVREKVSEISEIKVNGREAQYEYLLKIAEKCNEQTAVLYRDNESVIPLIDLLERNNVPYKIRNTEMSFFSNRLVKDICDILKFSENIYDIDLFESLYYKISSYLSKQAALDICRLSRINKSMVFEEIYNYPDIKPGTLKSMRQLEINLMKLKSDTPKQAINRIIKCIGYGEYMERTGLKDSKAFILKILAGREKTVDDFLHRIEELKEIIQNKENDAECKFILSTIHGSKGLEYDNVYIIDLEDGIFPEKVPKADKVIKKREIEVYEEERRLFYVGTTRAKNRLFLINSGTESSFITQFLYKKEKDKAYNAFIESLFEGRQVSHKNYGKGIIKEVNENNISIMFEENKTLKNFSLMTLFLNKLLITL